MGENIKYRHGIWPKKNRVRGRKRRQKQDPWKQVNKYFRHFLRRGACGYWHTLKELEPVLISFKLERDITHISPESFEILGYSKKSKKKKKKKGGKKKKKKKKKKK